MRLQRALVAAAAVALGSCSATADPGAQAIPHTLGPAPPDSGESRGAPRPTHRLVLRPGYLALQYQPHEKEKSIDRPAQEVLPLPAGLPAVNFDALPLAVAKEAKAAHARVDDVRNELGKLSLEQFLTPSRQRLSGPAERDRALARIERVRAPALDAVRKASRAVSDALGTTSGSKTIEVLVARVVLLADESLLDDEESPAVDHHLHERLAGLEPGPRSCELALYLAQQWRREMCLSLGSFFDAARRYEPCRRVAYYNEGLYAFDGCKGTPADGANFASGALDHAAELAFNPQDPIPGVSDVSPFELAVARAWVAFRLGRPDMGLRLLGEGVDARSARLFHEDSDYLRYATDMADLTSETNLSGFPVVVRRAVLEQLAVRAVDRGDYARALELANRATPQINQPGHHLLAHEVKRYASARLGRPDAATSAFLDANPTGPRLRPAGSAERDEQWWRKEGLPYARRLARPVQSLTRLCLEPLLWRAPHELSTLMLKTRGRQGEPVLVEVTPEVADDFHGELARCMERLGPRVLSAVPVAYEALIDLRKTQGTGLQDRPRDEVE